ncbi:PadR family transcriptional regulator [Neobacillus rhizophilus]|uniref:Helix-turn-helix transcriptional regulator n=1 Tax=Neobacillus rhizophilus TaxID=2833579 RepID=A0A942U468_9BACI|nr:helix-turn-helix transcriptional regulator [Neobacillus rhizophilus]MBS4214360.1 helix-turn-helix transcriptional regulator [Neobacillus rhizophilus]MBU8915847.1 PadR family transcriptional regulator [Bacillus sp. FJAT-29953]
MKRDRHIPLTETVYYILLSLLEPAHGYLILQKVEELSGGQVRMAAGTLYGAIENLLKLKFIQPVPSEDSRRKVYLITDKGKEMLHLDLERMKHMIQVTEAAFIK